MKIKNNASKIITNKNINPLIQLYLNFNHLKELYRQGWLLKGVKTEKCESVADHLFGVTFLALILSEEYFPKVDKLKLLEMALIHEVGEIFIGDITPHDHISKSDKYMWEYAALTKLFSPFEDGKKYIQLWKEYEDGKTDEAKLLRQIDYLEMSFQGCVYKHQYGMDNTEFLAFTRRILKNKNLSKLLDEFEEVTRT